MEVSLSITADSLACTAGGERLIFSPGKLSQAHKAGDAWVLNFGVYPYHCLRIRNHNDRQILLNAWSSHPEIKALGRSHSRYFLWLTLGGIGFFFMLFLLLYFWLLPAFSNYVAHKISMDTERELGAKMFEALKQQYKTNDTLTRCTAEFFHALRFPEAEKVELIVVESNDTNAFAMPGGYMVVFKGILHKTKTPDQLAALLGHEYAHVRHRHSLRNLIATSTGGLLLSFLAGDLSGTLGGILLSQANEFKNLAYSRELETEADEMGMKMMALAGANPSAMADMLTQIQPSGGEEMPSFLSTHPVFSERIPHAKAFATSLKQSPQKSTYKENFERLKASLLK